MQTTRYGVTTNDYAGPSSITRTLAMLDKRIAEMKTEPEWKDRERDHTEFLARQRRTARGVPDRFLDASLEAWQPNLKDPFFEAKKETKAALLSWSEQIGKLGAPSLVVLGANGTGKTWAGCGLVNDRLSRLYTGEGIETRIVRTMNSRYITMKGYTDRVKATYRGGAEETETEVLNTFADVPLLVLDEIGRQFDTDSEKNYVFELINERYNRHHQTMLISNMAPEEFKTFMGEALLGRLREGGGKVLVFNWTSLRA